MVCAPWSNITFSCLSSRVDHTDCCKARGVSPFCLSMCSGDVKKLDYRHFRCLTHMSTYTNCILESHDVLPGEPQNFTVGPITSNWAVLNWKPPKRRSSSIQGYRIFWRRLTSPTQSNSASLAGDQLLNIGNSSLTETSSAASASLVSQLSGSAPINDEFLYSNAEAATNPYLLDALQADTVYETFVVAVNSYGQSKPSVRFLFQTLKDPADLRIQDSPDSSSSGDLESRLPIHANNKLNGGQRQTYYNETNCCINSGITPACKELCDYDLKVADAYGLITVCNSQMPTIIRCLAGSRNSVPCCRNRGVGDQCLNVCAGLTEHSPLMVASTCGSDFGKILHCLDEGAKQIPGAPIDLHTIDIKTDKVTLKWEPALEDKLRSDVEYHIRYQHLQPGEANEPINTDLSALIAVVPLHPLEHTNIITTNKTEATVERLQPGSRYSIYVTAENSYGISLPSLILVIQMPTNEGASNEEYKRSATIGPPHSLEVLRTDTETIFLKWSPPLYVESDAQLRYRVFYKLIRTTSSDNPSISENESSSGSGEIESISSNWTVVVTSDTNIVLRNLAYSSQYAITVQAFSKKLRGHMSEILLANTAKPVPPSINPPLIINQPIEGNNITIMCVALGSPTPQISMFINGLLVQKKTDPYVVYHLVNLVRGQLTISCFASNGRGKDYASVQSRTEISVKFKPRAIAKVREVKANIQSIARIGCTVTGNPQPSVIWTFVPTGNQNGTVIVPKDRISTLIVSQFDTPSTWSHTLTIRNVSVTDAGSYQCRALNSLSDSNDNIQLIVNDLTQSQSSGSQQSLKLYQGSDLLECCKSQNVSSKCLPVCSPDGLDIESAFRTPECQSNLDKLMFCAADGSDHRNCCRQRQVPFSCLRWCSGARLNIPAICFLSSAIDINQCFQEGRTLLPGPPQNLRALLAADSEHNLDSSGSSSEQNGYSPGTTTTIQVSPFAMGSAVTASGDSPSNQAQSSGSSSSSPSVIGSMVLAYGDTMSHGQSSSSMDSSSQNQTSVMSEPLIIEWDPPVKNPQLVQYYRIFWRPFGTRELSRTTTNLTWVKLNDLKMDRIYEFVVKAANVHGASVYSDPLTVKPAEVLASSRSLGLIWFIPTSSTNSLMGRILLAITFASCFMISSLILVLFLERRGYLKRFGSSKSNSSRISFANPAYMKDPTQEDDIGQNSSNNSSDRSFENIVWTDQTTDSHSLSVLSSPSQSPNRSSEEGSSSSSSSTSSLSSPNIDNPNYKA